MEDYINSSKIDFNPSVKMINDDSLKFANKMDPLRFNSEAGLYKKSSSILNSTLTNSGARS